MYLRAIHTAHIDIPAIQGFIKDNSLGILISAIESSEFPTLQCTHLPLVLDLPRTQSTDDLGLLRGHMARANPHAKALLEAAKAAGSQNYLPNEITIVFNGPADSYVTPKFYTTTKPSTGKVVPTWNYSAAQAYGKLKVYWDTEDASTGAFLSKQIDDLTAEQERKFLHQKSAQALTDDSSMSGLEKPWQVTDAPERYIDLLKKSIVGFEVQITRLEAKYKMTQEMGLGDRQGVIEGFEATGTENGRTMAKTIAERGALKDAAKAAR